MISAVGDREQTPTQIDAADRRQRAFSLFVKSYDQARRAIQYVRWEQSDADSIAPSLYSGRDNSNVKRRAEDAHVTPSPVVQVPAPVAVNGSADLAASASPGFARRCAFQRLVMSDEGRGKTVTSPAVYPFRRNGRLSRAFRQSRLPHRLALMKASVSCPSGFSLVQCACHAKNIG